MKSNPSKRLAVLFAAGMSLLPALTSAQCALCKQSLESGGGPGLIRGFFWSIVLLISLPVMMAFAFAWALHRGAKRRRELIEELGGRSVPSGPDQAAAPFTG